MANESLLKPMGNKSVVDRIIERILNTILSGELRPGDRIPTETELAESLGVARNSVREAVKGLVAMGILNIRRSEGTFVADGFSDRMLDPMIYGLILEGANTSAMLELRYAVDTGIVQMAIEKATEEDLERLRAALEELHRVIRCAPRAEEIHRADVAFHRELERIVNNALLDKISIVINRLTDASRKLAVEEMIRYGDLEYLYQLHKAMYDLIRDQDHANVSSVMEQHFGYWRKELVKQEESQ